MKKPQWFRNYFSGGSCPEFDFILKSFRFLIFKIPGSHQKLSQNEIWREDFFLICLFPPENFKILFPPKSREQNFSTLLVPTKRELNF
jgi:hypothetical protein